MSKIVEYVLSIEPMEGASFRAEHPLGSDIVWAKREAEETFAWRNDEYLRGIPRDAQGRLNATRTVALFLGRKMVDVFDGREWSSERE